MDNELDDFHFQYAKVSGDTEIFPEMYGVVKETLKYYAGFIQEDGGFLINAWNMMDWADMDIHNYGIVTGQQAVLAYCFGLAAAYAEKTTIRRMWLFRRMSNEAASLYGNKTLGF